MQVTTDQVREAAEKIAGSAKSVEDFKKKLIDAVEGATWVPDLGEVFIGTFAGNPNEYAQRREPRTNLEQYSTVRPLTAVESGVLPILGYVKLQASGSAGDKVAKQLIKDWNAIRGAGAFEAEQKAVEQTKAKGD